MSRWTTGAALAGAGLAAAGLLARRRGGIDFAGRSVLLTGGSRGLGLLLARRLAAEGALLTLVAREEHELAAAYRDVDARAPGRVLAVVADVRRRDEAERAVRQAVERFGRLDVLVNDAGVIQVGPWEHMELADFQQAMSIHFWAPLYLTMAAIPHLREAPGARVVNIASIGGLVAVPHLLPYTASKFALVGLSAGLGAELAREGIAVTTVCPGLLRTGSHVQAKLKGRHGEELTWFTLAGATPLSSMAAERAARKILAAVRRGQPRLVLSVQAKALATAASLAPNATARALALADRLLPRAAEGGEGDEARKGYESASRWVPSLLSRLADRAARENGELPAGAAAAYAAAAREARQAT